MLSTPKSWGGYFLASSLYDGLEDNNIQQVTTLLLNKEADPNVLIPTQGITPFHLVIGNDSEVFAEEVTKLFLRHGGNPNVKSVDGMSPVHVAAAWGRIGVLELLLANGGDPLQVDDDGRSPFHYAFDGAHYDVIAMLGKYCGEPHEEDSKPKYKIALDKVIISSGEIVAEYAVSDDTFITADDVPSIHMTNVCNNNNGILSDLNEKQAELKNTKHFVSDWCNRYLNDNVTSTSTSDESSISMGQFVTVRRHQRCLPTNPVKKKERASENKVKFKLEEQDFETEKLLVSQIIDRLSTSHLNDAKIDESFFINPKKSGENMPRISSPKNERQLVSSANKASRELQSAKYPKTTPKTVKNPTVKTKFIHKTPLRSCPKREPSSAQKPLLSAKTNYHQKSKITPVKQIPSVEKKTPMNTPSRFFSKENQYLPNCSIVSKSPNLIITPTNSRKYNDHKVTTHQKPSPQILTKTPIRTSRTPISDKAKKSTPRFVKQSDLRNQLPTVTSKRSPIIFHQEKTPTNLRRTPNLTDSTKKKRGLSSTKKTTPSYSGKSPVTPLNKTYNKIDPRANIFSPDVGNTRKFIDRKTLAKNVAMKLEESLYDENYENSTKKNLATPNYPNRISSATSNLCTALANPPFIDKNSGENGSNSSDISNILDNRSKVRTTTNNFASLHQKCDLISGFDFLPNSLISNDATKNSIYRGSQSSEVLAGFLMSDSRSSIEINNVGRLQSAVLAGHFYRNKSNLISLDPCCEIPSKKHCKAMSPYLKESNSREIDDSLISTDHSSCSTDDRSEFLSTRNDCSKLNVSPGKLQAEKKSSLDNCCTPPIAEYKCNENCPAAEQMCTTSANVSSGVGNSCYESFVSVEEEYKYEDAEAGVILMERRLLVTPASIPMIKSEDKGSTPSVENSSSNDDSLISRASSLPQSLAFMDSETLRRELTKLDRPPGPITATTRLVYLKRLWKLQKHGLSHPPRNIAKAPGAPMDFGIDLDTTLHSEILTSDLTMYKCLEQQVFSEFAKPDPTRRWREGTTKSSFNYLLLDPRVTDNLPRRADTLSIKECWKTFISAIFYVGKGKRSRPYAHLYEAGMEWNKEQRSTHDKKINHIIDIWKHDYGVVCLHLFQNTIPVEAYTREAAMIEVLGLDKLRNSKLGDYYGVAATWSRHQKRMLGLYLLYKAMNIFLNEGERQLCPQNIGR